MTAFHKFDPWAFLGESAPLPPKPAKPAKEDETLAALAALAAPSAPVAETDFEERAALVEHEAGVPRAWAEGLALLHPDRPPAHVSPRRWLTFCNDAGAFIDRWAPQAAALGWSTVEVFGVHRTRPVERFDGAGLVWLLNGATIEALTADVVTVRTPHGTRQTIRRRPDNAANERVIAWEIER